MASAEQYVMYQLRTKAFLNKALASTGNQIREQVCIESSARPVQCMKANTES